MRKALSKNEIIRKRPLSKSRFFERIEQEIISENQGTIKTPLKSCIKKIFILSGPRY